MAETKTPPEPLILVVEDEELLRLHAADLLEEHGFRVVEARNAAAALKVLESRDDVRLLFTDIQMPGALDGMDLAREVHQRGPGVLLVITSGQKKPTEAEIPDHGRFVAKPYRAAELLGQVDDMIHKASGGRRPPWDAVTATGRASDKSSGRGNLPLQPVARRSLPRIRRPVGTDAVRAGRLRTWNHNLRPDLSPGTARRSVVVTDVKRPLECIIT